jgi:DNA-binding CsgD family transcriptional regulator
MTPEAALVGRDEELEAIARLLGATGWSALVFEGEAGIGKTTVWRSALEQARTDGHLVLEASSARAEQPLSFAGLADIFEPVLDAVALRLPDPQRRALEVALLLSELEGEPVDARTIATAALGSLRLLASEQPVLLALDDLQWIDAATAEALGFALRRVRDEPVKLLVTLRLPGRAPGALGPVIERADRFELAPLRVGALHRLIHRRLGLALRRPALIKLAEISGGNPFYALELARALTREGEMQATAGSVELDTLLRERLQALPPPTRDALLTLSILGRPTRSLVTRLHDPAALRPAFEVQMVEERAGGRLAFTHPLLGAAVYARSDEVERRDRHLEVAALVEDDERALHLALGTEAASERVADELSRAAAAERGRGASARAAELLDHAARLTPSHDGESLGRRELDAAVALFDAGDSDGAAARLEALTGRLEHGLLLTEAMREFGRVLTERGEGVRARAYFERALAECPTGAPALRAGILRDLAWGGAFLGRRDEAVLQGREAVAEAERSGDPSLLVDAIAAAALAEFGVGGERAARDLLTRGVELERSIGGCRRLGEGPRAVLVYQLMVGLELAEARPLCEELLQAAVERGGVEAEAASLYYLARLETFAGRLDVAEEVTASLRELAQQWGAYGAEVDALDALYAALRGRSEEARALAQRRLAGVASTADVLTCSAILGLLALSEARPSEAAPPLRRCEELALEDGAREPGVTRFRPDLVEALVGIGELAEAEEVLGRFEAAARELDRGWALAVAARGRGLLMSAHGDAVGALGLLEGSLVAIERLDVPFERARTLLALGAVARRAKSRARARGALEAARAGFEQLGTPLWAERAHEELRRVGGRSSHGSTLTETERRVAELVGAGLSNKEAAAALFVSVRSIEAHLTRIYTKLGVRSRTQLAATLTAGRAE